MEVMPPRKVFVKFLSETPKRRGGGKIGEGKKGKRWIHTHEKEKMKLEKKKHNKPLKTESKRGAEKAS